MLLEYGREGLEKSVKRMRGEEERERERERGRPGERGKEKRGEGIVILII